MKSYKGIYSDFKFSIVESETEDTLAKAVHNHVPPYSDLKIDNKEMKRICEEKGREIAERNFGIFEGCEYDQNESNAIQELMEEIIYL